MRKYRAFLLDVSGRVTDASIIIHEANDEAAIETATTLLDTHDIALWQDDRLVATLRRKDTARETYPPYPPKPPI